MTALFWFALVVGGGLLLFSLLGDLFGADGVDGAADAEIDADLDLDFDGGLDAADAVDAADAADAVEHDRGDAHAAKIVSLRTLTYFLFGFGTVGVALDWLWQGDRTTIATLAATATGLVAGGVSAVVFGYIRGTESGFMRDDGSLVGAAGRVTLPLRADGTGKVLVERSGREHELLARPFDAEGDAEAGAPPEWVEVVVVDIDDGVALVTPLQALPGSRPAPEDAG